MESVGRHMQSGDSPGIKNAAAASVERRIKREPHQLRRLTGDELGFRNGIDAQEDLLAGSVQNRPQQELSERVPCVRPQPCFFTELAGSRLNGLFSRIDGTAGQLDAPRLRHAAPLLDQTNTPLRVDSDDEDPALAVNGWLRVRRLAPRCSSIMLFNAQKLIVDDTTCKQCGPIRIISRESIGF